MRATIRALQRGYTQAQTEPDERRRGAARRARRARPGRGRARSSTPSRPRSPRAPGQLGELREDVLRKLGPASGPALRRSLSRAPRRLEGVRRSTRWAAGPRCPSANPSSLGGVLEGPDAAAYGRRSTSAAPSRAIRERGTTRSKPAASARRFVSASTCEYTPSVRVPASSPCPRRRSTSATPSNPVEARSTISASAPSGCASAPLSDASYPAALSMPSTLDQQQVVEDGDDACHLGCARMRRNSCRTDSGRPHIWVVSTRPVRHSRRTSSPSMPASSSSFSVPCTAGAAAAWPNWWATRIFQCQSWCEYGSALHVTTSVAASM